MALRRSLKSEIDLLIINMSCLDQIPAELYQAEDRYESLFTILMWGLSRENVVEKLFRQLKLVQNVKNSFKRKKINDRLYGLIEYLKENYEENDGLNLLCLVGDDVNCFELGRSDLGIMREYQVPDYIFKYGGSFELGYVKDLFQDLDFRIVIQAKNNEICHYLLNSTKKKVVYQGKCKDLDKYVLDHEVENGLIYGVSSLLKKFKGGHQVVQGNLDQGAILELFEQDEMRGKHVLLQDLFDILANEQTMHLVIYGPDEVQQAIEYFRVEQLFCSVEQLERLKGQLDPDCFNFKVHVIRKLEDGDVGDRLIKDYNGMLAKAYY